MSNLVSIQKKANISIISIDNPPANALSFGVVKGISEFMVNCEEDADCAAIVITGSGRMFIAGAEIREFNLVRPKDVPELHSVISAIEGSSKPVLAAINGIAFGGGLELAMGCHYRVIKSGAKVGQPEVKLGIIPGAGGTQRLPRLAGIEAALEIIVGGEPIDSDKALSLGIVDKIIEEAWLEEIIKFAKQKIAQGPRPTRDMEIRLSASERSIFESHRSRLSSKNRGMDAPLECVNAIEAAAERSFSDGLKFERKIFEKLKDGSKSKAMRHMFFAEREVAKIPDVSKDVGQIEIKTAAVIGSGTMGGGIAMNFANSGLPVKVLDISNQALEAGLLIVRNNYANSVRRNRLSQDEMDKRLSLISTTTNYDDIAGADIIVEAALESMSLKKDIFKKLDNICKKETILASNTSSLNIDELGEVTDRPDKVCGMHFFSPANVMKLIENVRTRKASKETVATIMGLSKKLGKVGVIVGVGDGFVGNRMLHIAARIAEFMVEEGALPWEVDKVIYEFGFPMGPFAMNDLAGVDVRYLIREEQKKIYKNRRQSVIIDRLYATGRYGQKTGGGWYDYSEGSRVGTPASIVNDLIVKTSNELGFERRSFSGQEILDRYMFSIINTGALVLEEKLALRSSDIDVIWHYGYGFPRYRGGPMFYADLIGLDKIYDKVSMYYDEYGDWLRPSELLKDLAKKGKSFKDYAL
ncbi:MAG: 3-hydroxyacyl-CoA dehydrogenase NAD-binding domain-containing protein [Pseudomonadota bacterium]|nr:3-hydroxyacyl-CoA dehydrogenase NAD-binding domain-containing protein [Pseudomonadota bacterium]